ncbi:flagellar basal body-associated protein FliL [Campylobacter pinnipediorum]|uniref:flagellar basal body-associated protein FliL n=1 Tax=Campylobacter pinnipediorum TaxID=1965231 RepID=UPI00084D96DD|nr:flagellar basal body-associated protein FliL [Campylobacter pinnipediorum]
MADEEKEVKEETQKSGKGLIVAIIGVVIVLLLAIGGVIIFLLSGDDENTQMQQQVSQTAPKSRMPGKRSSDYMNMGPIYPLDQFIVNLLSENGSRFLKTKIDLEQSNESLAAELDKKKALLRDIIIRTLSSKTFEEVSTAKGKDKLKDEIVGKINEVLSDGYIKNIYFTDFVVQ